MNITLLANLIAVFVLTLVPNASFASDKADVVAAVYQFFQNLSPANINKATAMCDSPVSILDEFPPYHWAGPTACADWWKALNDYNREEGITNALGDMGKPWTVDVESDRAYFVAPTTYIYNQHGKRVQELHSVYTFALRRTKAGWRITAWSWSKH